jgi:hypothetical protein
MEKSCGKLSLYFRHGIYIQNLMFFSADFNAIGKGGLFYLFVSMKNFHGFMKEMRSRFFEASFIAGLQVGKMRQDLKIPDGESTDNPIDAWAMLGAGFTIASGSSGAFPAASGISAVGAGVMSILSNVKKP